MLHLNSPLTELYSVGKVIASLLKKLGLTTVQDLLFYLPFRYEDFSQQTAIDNLEPGQSVNIQGTIELISNKKSPRRKMYITEALVANEGGTIKATWFNQPFLTRNYRVGDEVSLAGKTSENYGQICLISPVIEKIYATGPIHTSGLIPNYRLTANVTQKQLRFLIKKALPLAKQIKDWLPDDIRKRLGLIELSQALKQTHFPSNQEEIVSARKRLAFTELFLRQLKAQMIKQELSSRQAPELVFAEQTTKDFVATLPFKLTDSQRQAAWEILRDLTKSSPMSRLLAGDVGSGKTIVVIIALLNTVLNKRQAVLMVPTTILAQQHFATVSSLLAKYDCRIALLTNHSKAQERRQALDADIIIGTHALIQDKVAFPRLALVVIDEQHRFGVSQRQKIIHFPTPDGLTPHFLSLTATPIPRSLALAIYGDLNLSLLKEKPLGRRPIHTKVVLESQRSLAYDFIGQQIKNGQQVFVICPLIDPSDLLGARSAKEEYTRLSEEVFPDLKIGLLHGKLKTEAKNQVMADFLDNKINILVSTSVIEVGVDVPNATIMMIEGAERFGLAQLHQFRGRVGRGNLDSYCFLFPSQEETASSKTLERLAALTKHQDGLELAKIDLRLRGAGEVYGTNQSGFSEIQTAALFDYATIKLAQGEAAKIISQDPTLQTFPQLKAKLGEWEASIHLE